MNDVDLRTRIMQDLYERRSAATDGVGATEVAPLAQRVGAPALRTAVICSDLVRHRHLESDGNMMGFVRLSDIGMAYYEEVIGMG